MKIVLVTAPDEASAKKLARRAISSKLCACVNILPSVKSIYWWEGEVQESAELLLMLKTDEKNVYRLEELILEEHPYSTPEFVVVDSSFVTAKYKKWLEENLV